MKKKCSKCGVEKEISEFHKCKRTKSGRRATCKRCQYLSSKEYHKQYYIDNKQKINDYSKSYYQNNKIYQKDYQKIWRKNNEERYNKYKRNWQNKNKDKLKLYKKKWEEENKQKRSEYQKKWKSEKRKKDQLFNLKNSIRNRLWCASKGRKSNSTIDLLGCSWEQLLLHLNYNNFKNPSHDHIIPLSWAETEEELYALARWENLQGMELKDNFLKNNKYCCVDEASFVLKNHPNQNIIKLILSRMKKDNNRYTKY